MKFDIIDPNVGLTMNIFLILGNAVCIGYNIPQMIQTYRTRSTRDINEWFIILRILGNSPFVVYSIYVGEANLFISYTFSVLASLFIGYFKYMDMKKRRDEPLIDDEKELKDVEEIV
jgi:uncharacterized protein with PQ loop repeat